MRYSAEPAYVLHARDWRETSALVEVLSAHHGRLALVARGVRGTRRQPLRQALTPLQWIQFDGVQRGEMARLDRAEALDALPLLDGERALSGFYLNELVLRLSPRQLPNPELFAVYGRARAEIAHGDSIAWTLRRFERDLLDSLGVGFEWSSDAQGEPIDPAARYRLRPEAGAERVVRSTAGERGGQPTGRVLLALATDAAPETADLPALRWAMRALLLHHLGGHPLQSWSMAGQLSRWHGGQPAASNASTASAKVASVSADAGFPDSAATAAPSR